MGSVIHHDNRLSTAFNNTINAGGHVLVNVQQVYINEEGQLSLDNNHLTLSHLDRLSLINNKQKARAENVIRARLVDREKFHPKNNKIKLKHWSWTDGTYVAVDNRGLLHIKSSVSGLPEVTLVLTLAKAVACWASDGTVAGASYFTGLPEKPDHHPVSSNTRILQSEDRQAHISIKQFYAKYIHPILEKIKEDGVTV